jgi:hypothetical protein
MDTTGLAYRREDRFLRFRRGEEVRRVRGHARLLALVRWERERRLLLPWGGVAGRGYAPDPQLGGKALRRFAPTGGWLLADAGFDGKEVWEALRGEGLRPVIRLRGEARMEARVRAREGWDPEVYRFRGVVEGVFGGMKTRLGGAYLWERKPWTAMVRATGGSKSCFFFPFWSLTKTANLSLTVTAAPDFTISLNPTSLTVQQGSSGTTRLTITPLNGFTGTVNLELVGAPSGVTLSPTSVDVTGSEPRVPGPDRQRGGQRGPRDLQPPGAGHQREPHQDGEPEPHGDGRPRLHHLPQPHQPHGPAGV